VESSLGAAEHEDAGKRRCGIGGGLGMEQDANESVVAYFGANQRWGHTCNVWRKTD
jgi:hypothetical protein